MKTRKNLVSQSETKSDPRSLFDVAECVFDIPELEIILKARRSKVYQKINAGELKTVKDGNRTLVTGAEVRRYLRELASRAA